MRILFCGDVMGRVGRELIAQYIPRLRAEWQLDAVIINGENAAAGRGMTKKIVEEFLAAGVDVVTAGNHVWDQKEFVLQIDALPQVLRPLNVPANTPGKGYNTYRLKDGREILVIHLIGQLFATHAFDNPFPAADDVLKKYQLGKNIAAIVVDFHADGTSEKMALGHHLDGRVSLVVGTNTHVPTADTMVLPNGTAYQTDAGMCGDYDSVIGMRKDLCVPRFTRRFNLPRMEPAEGAGTLCGLLVETNDVTGLAISAKPIRLGGKLIAAN